MNKNFNIRSIEQSRQLPLIVVCGTNLSCDVRCRKLADLFLSKAEVSAGSKQEKLEVIADSWNIFHCSIGRSRTGANPLCTGKRGSSGQ